MPVFLSPHQATTSSHVILDVREFPEYAAGSIPGSRLCPLSTLEQAAASWDKSTPLLLVCRTGKRAAQAAGILQRLGFQNVCLLQGGLEAWKAAGLPVESQKQAPWPLERQVRAIAGSAVLLFTLLGLFLSPWFLAGTLFVGAGLVFSAVTNLCLLASLLAKLPWNRPPSTVCPQ